MQNIVFKMSSAHIHKLQLSNFSISVLYDIKNKNSLCWRHFGELILEKGNKKSKVFTDKVFCNQCLTQIKFESSDISFGLAKIKSYTKTVSTGNLIRHLRDSHDIRDDNPDKSKRLMNDFFTPRPRLRTAAVSASSMTATKKDKWLLARDLALWFCSSLMPFDAVSDQGMIDFFKKHNIIVTNDDMPSRYTISRTALDDIYETMLKNVKDQILTCSPRHVSVTFDLWTDQYRRLSYITFTIHYVTADFELKNFTLSTRLIQGKKTGEKIQDTLNKMKFEFGLCGKELHTVTDGGSNVKRAIALSGLDSHLCLGHGLHNLVVVDGINSLPQIESIVRKCKKIVKAIRYRLPELEADAEDEQVQFLQLLESVSETLESDENVRMFVDEGQNSQPFNDEFGEISHVPTIKTSTPTRWHSVLSMLESMAHFCNRSPINNILSKIGQEDIKLVQTEWNLLEDLIRFLRKFRDAVEVLSAQKTASINLALIFRSEIKDILNSISDEETIIMVSLKNNMLTKIDQRFPLTKHLVVAALLDSRFSGLKEIDSYLERENKTRASFLEDCIRDYVRVSDLSTRQESGASTSISQSSNSQPSSSTQSLLSKLSRKYSSHSYSEPTEDSIQECWKYIATANPKELEALNGDIFAFWREKRNAFPWLAALARAVLAIPATSTPSERVFSVARLVLNAKRSRLNPVQVNKIIFVHDNYNNCKETCEL